MERSTSRPRLDGSPLHVLVGGEIDFSDVLGRYLASNEVGVSAWGVQGGCALEGEAGDVYRIAFHRDSETGEFRAMTTFYEGDQMFAEGIRQASLNEMIYLYRLAVTLSPHLAVTADLKRAVQNMMHAERTALHTRMASLDTVDEYLRGNK